MIRSKFRKLLGSKDEWPMPKISGQEPHFLFIVTPPYSGSTALAAILQSSPHVASLQERAEGQWLIPELSAADRWKPNKYIDYESVRRVWLARAAQIKTEQKDVKVIVEKSPPNMVRLGKLIERFASYSLLANNRNPYANISSLSVRVGNADQSESERLEQLSFLAKRWVERSELIQSLISQYKMNLITYEQFCANPEILLAMLNLPKGIAETVVTDQEISIKGQELKPLVNYNQKQISLLSAKEIEVISDVLQNHQKLLTFFGYELQIQKK